MAHKVTHPESICEMLHTLRIITDHIATIQLAAIKSHVAGVHMNQRNRKKNKTYVEFGLTYHTPTVNISDFVGNILKFRYRSAGFN